MKRVIVISAALALLVGVVFLAVNMGGGSTVRGQEEPTPTPTPTPTPLPAECDIGVVAPGIVASTNSLVMKVGDPPAVVDLTATFKNNGAVTQGVPDETCSFARVYAAEIGTGDILTDTPVDPTKLGVRVEPVGNASPPYGDVCIECSAANKALGWTAAECTLQGHGMGDYYPTPPPPWDYYLMPCDEQTWPAALPFSMTAHSCEDGLDNLGSEAGTCDWGGFSKQCVTPTTADATCLDVPLIGLIPLFRAVLAPDATDTTAREVKIECREPGTYSLVLAAGVGKASTSTSAPYLGPNQDPNQANDIATTVVTVTCTDATPTPTPTPLPAECDIGVVAPGIVASTNSLVMKVGDPPAVVDLTATFKNNGAVTSGALDATCSVHRVYAAEIGTGDILTDTPVDPTKLGVRVEPVGNASPPYGDVCLQCSATNQALGMTAAQCVLLGGNGIGSYPPTPVPSLWDYVPVPCDEGAFNPAVPVSLVNHSVG